MSAERLNKKNILFFYFLFSDFYVCEHSRHFWPITRHFAQDNTSSGLFATCHDAILFFSAFEMSSYWDVTINHKPINFFFNNFYLSESLLRRESAIVRVISLRISLQFYLSLWQIKKYQHHFLIKSCSVNKVPPNSLCLKLQEQQSNLNLS